MKYFRIKQKKNSKYKIQQKSVWWETMIGSNEFDSVKECLDFIHDGRDPNECDIKYDKPW